MRLYGICWHRQWTMPFSGAAVPLAKLGLVLTTNGNEHLISGDGLKLVRARKMNQHDHPGQQQEVSWRTRLPLCAAQAEAAKGSRRYRIVAAPCNPVAHRQKLYSGIHSAALLVASAMRVVVARRSMISRHHDW